MTIQAHEAQFTVRGYDCGYGGPLRTLALADFLQEAASQHAESLGWGRDGMGQSGRTWMLTRIDLRLAAAYALALRENDWLTVRTWPAAIERLFALRDFELEGPDGERLAAATYSYLIVDIASRRPLRPEGILPPDLHSPRPRAVAEGWQAIGRPTEAPVEAFRQRAGRRHIDHNGHVNNAHLLTWLVDAVPTAAVAGSRLAALRVEFVREVLPGDEVAAVAAPLAGGPAGQRGFVSELCRAGNSTDGGHQGGEVCARAETWWQV
ncbi:MAG: hypothetical protein A2087_13810 [Spirochaetes bacterium GWD1_61_31]|nr:MAG: hypothetical protein A2Y37_10335 [Spirochaetes bacterium GWB1_60_80]OHD33756.1 MAG: hypothetical protein A2004_09605 [Spirochaetes bacterium GWC1_61_12]OHD38979.1 MAG: hypothetical protein A2087_13810 [Spirochaetes bacterium GWD1_61_31]OHD43429.1 MAG: hypothetical protein A2Y35_11705 [Spirochaetes bacterium GWE1_60_18]OHD58960.1 MAG: hypothetical protein A2Y32_10495 [Spirochaetes bacterium GWF1_60_12]HAP42641.1 hypothetical protein [Spirochaetaceae bacterium]